MTMTTVNVHLNDETLIKAEKVSNFVALRVGPDVDLFLMNSEQASRLAEAAEKAWVLLREIEGAPASSNAEQMLEAGKAWLVSIGLIPAREVNSQNLGSLFGWDVEDWDVVLKRHGSKIVATDKLVYEFRAQYDRATV